MAIGKLKVNIIYAVTLALGIGKDWIAGASNSATLDDLSKITIGAVQANASTEIVTSGSAATKSSLNKNPIATGQVSNELPVGCISNSCSGCGCSSCDCSSCECSCEGSNCVG